MSHWRQASPTWERWQDLRWVSAAVAAQEVHPDQSLGQLQNLQTPPSDQSGLVYYYSNIYGFIILCVNLLVGSSALAINSFSFLQRAVSPIPPNERRSSGGSGKNIQVRIPSTFWTGLIFGRFFWKLNSTRVGRVFFVLAFFWIFLEYWVFHTHPMWVCFSWSFN